MLVEHRFCKRDLIANRPTDKKLHKMKPAESGRNRCNDGGCYDSG